MMPLTLWHRFNPTAAYLSTICSRQPYLQRHTNHPVCGIQAAPCRTLLRGSSLVARDRKETLRPLLQERTPHGGCSQGEEESFVYAPFPHLYLAAAAVPTLWDFRPRKDRALAYLLFEISSAESNPWNTAETQLVVMPAKTMSVTKRSWTQNPCSRSEHRAQG